MWMFSNKYLSVCSSMFPLFVLYYEWSGATVKMLSVVIYVVIFDESQNIVFQVICPDDTLCPSGKCVTYITGDMPSLQLLCFVFNKII